MSDDTKRVLRILSTIQALNELFSKYKTYSLLPIHKNIWRGSYDVWSCEQDMIDSVEIPKSFMKRLKDEELITSRSMIFCNREIEVWSLTETGEKLIKEESNVCLE